MKVAFLHPDLGIGGAERLVVDCALALQQLGNEVTVYTSHYDSTHAFDETRELRIEVLGNSVFPRNVFGRFSILCSILRQLHLTSQLKSRNTSFDLFVVDQLSAAIPYLRTAFPNARILFYCHHPDLVLSERKSVLKKVYRLPFDAFEKWTTGLSDLVAVNSEYTRSVFVKTFGSICDPSVLYPAVAPAPKLDASLDLLSAKLEPYINQPKPKLFLSINRFERKKDVELAISAFSLLLHMHEDLRDVLFVVAGGYDLRIAENKEYLLELQSLCKKFRVPSETLFPSESWSTLKMEKFRVLFLPSVGSQTKQFLLQSADILLYTPTNEHFGIVPLESMQVGTPVLATNTGGPLETVLDGKTGWLREPVMEEWYKVLNNVSSSTRAEIDAMASACRAQAAKFDFVELKQQLSKLAVKTVERERKNEPAIAKQVKLVSYATVLAFVLLVLVGYIAFRVVLAVWEVTLKL